MKILLVSVKSEISRGGIAVWTERFLNRCAQLNIQCLLVNTELLGKRAVQHRANYHLIDELTRTRRIFSQLKAGLKQKPDVAHINTSCGTFGLLRDCIVASRIRRAGVKRIVHYHCDIPHWIQNPVSRYCLGWLARNSSQNVVLCASSERYLKEQFGVQSVRIPNFIEESLVRTDEKPISRQLKRVLYVGRTEEDKGSRELYQVAKAFPDVRFEIIGEISPDAVQWQVPDNVQHLGVMSHEQVLAQLDSADLFFFPSHTEGCSMALMEALARGVPAVATDTGANADLLGADCGILVPVGDTGKMVQALKTLENPQLRARMSASAVSHIRKNFTQSQMDRLLTLMQTLHNT